MQREVYESYRDAIGYVGCVFTHLLKELLENIKFCTATYMVRGYAPYMVVTETHQLPYHRLASIHRPTVEDRTYLHKF